MVFTIFTLKGLLCNIKLKTISLFENDEAKVADSKTAKKTGQKLYGEQRRKEFQRTSL